MPRGVALLVILACASPVAAQDGLDDVRDLLVGRTAVCRIDHPVLKGVPLTADGRLDEKQYAKRTKKHRPAFRAGERAEITKVELTKKGELRICLGNCGITFLGPGSRIMGDMHRIGSAIVIPLPPDQIEPRRVLALISGAITVEGAEEALAGPAAGAQDAALEIVAVAVEPERVAPGDTARLVIQFDVSGAGEGMAVTEERQLYFSGTALLTNPISNTEMWRDGRHRTSHEFRVPQDAASGEYTFRATIRGDVGEHAGSAALTVE